MEEEKCLQTTVNDLNPNTVFGFPMVSEESNENEKQTISLNNFL